MAFPIFPLSPMPVNMTRIKDWGENVTVYDSGDSQGDTPFMKPLYDYSFPIQVMNELKQNSLWAFWDTRKGRTTPFLMRDPYDYAINSVLGVRSGITNAATLFLCDINSYMVRADTITISSLFSASSGYVRLGVEYSYDQDAGILTVNTKGTADVWGVRSAYYWKKVRYMAAWHEKSVLWNLFSVDGVSMKEMP